MSSAPLSVYYHPCVYFRDRFGGIARYICELANHLRALGVQPHIPTSSTRNHYLMSSPWVKEFTAGAPPIPLHRKLLRMAQPLASKRKKMAVNDLSRQALSYLVSHRFDLIHPSDTFCTEILPHLGHTPLVVTVHDMTHELFPEYYGSDTPYSRSKRAFVERAERIIAISHTTKRHLVELFGTDPERIDVIHHGNSLVPPPDVDQRLTDLPEPYILYVGSRWTYKNFETLLRAFVQLRSEEPELRLICSGSPATKAEKRLMEQLRLRDRDVIFMRTDDEDLAALYYRCRCFVYPSRSEGFGLPLLEAFACSAPVACSRASCFPEIAGDAALYFDPNSAEDMAATILRCIRSEDLRRGLISAGTERLKLFSWDRCARQTLDTYHKALGK